MSPSKATSSKVPTTKSFEPPMNIPGTSSNRSYMNSVSASPISGTSNSSPNYPLFENTPERGVEKQNGNRTMATQTEGLNSSERALRAQTCPVDLPGPLLQSNDASRPIQAVRVDYPAVNKPGSSQTGQKFSVPAKPANNGLLDPKADESQQGQAGPAVAPPRPAFKRPYPAQGAANPPKMGKWTREFNLFTLKVILIYLSGAGQLQMMSQAGQTGQTQMMAPSTSTQNNSLRTAPAGTSQMMQETSSNVVKSTSQTGPIKQSPTTPARLPGSVSMISTTPALKSNDSQAKQKRATRVVPARPKQDVLMAPSSDRSQSGEVGPAQAEVSGQTASSQSTSADLQPAPETRSSEAEQKRAPGIVQPEPENTQEEESQSAPSSSKAVMPPPRAALWRECRSKPTVAQRNEELQRVRMSTPIPDNSLYKIRIGQEFQANITEESLSNSDSDRDEAIWRSPESEESQCNTATIQKEYWCTIWRQFEGRFLYEEALQHLMKNEYSIEKAFESIEVCLGKLRPRILLREAHIEHYKELLQEQAFDEEYYRNFDNKKEVSFLSNGSKDAKRVLTIFGKQITKMSV
ncbi:hypothetical protein CRE_31635 [Caenorhabditis remanei]|uniref:ELM2 domain-containing protein n=1 Tax=Caenorhabditis remanei TaxID=31234 RepID=E3NTV0_CAERE|nr:hypothetical protein CRE_31635 [Caenorhabditis remanei]